MRNKDKSPGKSPAQDRGSTRAVENAHSWVAHFFLEWNPYNSAVKVKEIVDDQSSKFKKVIIYAKNDKSAMEIFNFKLAKIQNNNKVIMTSSHDANTRQEKYFNFILVENRVLITSLPPSQIFLEGKIDVEDVDLIINEGMPKQSKKYAERIFRSSTLSRSRIGRVITLVESQKQVEKVSQDLGVRFQNYLGGNTSNQQPSSRNRQSTSRSPIRIKPGQDSNGLISTDSQKKLDERPRTPVTKRDVSPKPNYQEYRSTQGVSYQPNFYSMNYQKQGDQNNNRSTSRNGRGEGREGRDSSASRRQAPRNKTPTKNSRPKNNQKLQEVRKNVIGLNTRFQSGFLLNLEAVYVDHTATNRPYKAVQQMVEHAKLLAANPHTQFSHFGEYSTNLMKYAKNSLLKSFNAPEDEYVTLPTGAGSTGAIEKAVLLLKGLSEADKRWDQPQIFITPYQHHSNILPWVEFYGNIEVLAHNNLLSLDMKKIYQQILNCRQQCVIISVSAASNVTSKLTHLAELNGVIKKIRQSKSKTVVFCVDCAAFCCHQQLDLQVYDEIDFAFLSPHKNLGGAESCGVLVGRNSIMSRFKPTFPGGGTVKFVKGYTKEDVMYESDNFAREIAGTPPFFGFYRAALSFQLLTNVIGYDFIHQQENENTQHFFERIVAINDEMRRDHINTKIQIYGDKRLSERANVVTFNIVYTENEIQKSVQQNFVSLILTDIFGIQVRSGCFCAGPHGIKLLNLTDSNIRSIEEEVEAGLTINKPGYVRIDLAFYLELFEIQYIADSIALIARYWKNYEKVYTLSKQGQIYLPHSMTKKRQTSVYSLQQINRATERVRQEENTHEQKLRNRKDTLRDQLRLGEQISRNPVEYMNKIIRSEIRH